MEDSLDREKRKIENEKKKKRKTTKKQKKEGSSPETRFKNIEEIFLKRGRNEKIGDTRIKHKMRCVTQIKFQNIFENLFFEGQKSRLFKTKVFFVQKKWKRQKKIGDAKVDKKAPKTIATRRKEKRNKKNVLLCQKKEKNKTKRTEGKMVKKEDEKNEE